MPKIVRAKFRCDEVGHTAWSRNPKLNAVGDNSPENNGFNKATPFGKLEMQVDNPEVFDFFEPEAEYYIDFVKVEKLAEPDTESALESKS